MARRDWSATNFLRCTTAIATAAPLTMAAWAKTSITGTQQAIVGCYTSGSSGNYFLLFSGSTDQIAAGTAAAVLSQAVTSTTITANTWFHACGVYASATDRRAFLNGGGKGTNATSRIPAGIDRTSIGLRDGSLGDFPFAPAGTGDIAEVAIWSDALSDTDVASLADGIHPFLVRPDILVAYWPILGRYSPENNLKSNANTMAIQGALSQSAHTRIFNPAQVNRVYGKPAVPKYIPWDNAPPGGIIRPRPLILPY